MQEKIKKQNFSLKKKMRLFLKKIMEEDKFFS